MATTTWEAASKKKKAFSMYIFASITAQAAIISRSAIIFMTRMELRITYPGPAREFLKDSMDAWALPEEVVVW